MVGHHINHLRHLCLPLAFQRCTTTHIHMSSFAVRIKSVFVPSTRRAPSTAPAPVVPAINPTQCDSQPSPAMSHKTTSTMLSETTTANVHFSPEQVEHRSRSAPRYAAPKRSNSSNSTLNYKTSPPRSRSQSTFESKRREHISAFSSVRVPTVPGVSTTGVPYSILLSSEVNMHPCHF